MWKKVTLGAIVGGIILEVMKQSLSPWAFASFHQHYDHWTCGGRAAMAEGDRLSTQASAEVAKAQALFREANVHYAKAYACGFPDAGIRLAVAHCMGLGTAKEPSKARQIVLQIEAKHPEKVGRAADVRRACGL
jgi:hypothetical protein